MRHFLIHIGSLMWSGLWTGFGVEGSFFLLWAFWHLFYRKTAHKVNPENFIHRVHDYFNS